MRQIADTTTDPLLDALAATPALDRLRSAVEGAKGASAVGSAGSSTALITGAIASTSNAPVLLVVAHVDDADNAVEDLLARGVRAARLPAIETLPGEASVSLDLLAERLAVLRRVNTDDAPSVLCASMHALMQAVPSERDAGALSLSLRTGDTLPMDDLVRWLDDAGYQRRDAIEEPGDFAVRGGILDLFTTGTIADGAAGVNALRFDFFGDDIDSINEVDLDTMGSDRKLTGVELVGASPERVRETLKASGRSAIDLLPSETLAVIAETVEITEQGRSYYERVHADGGIFGPPEVFKRLREHCRRVVEINQFSSGSDTGGAIALPIEPLPELSRDVAEAIGELGTVAPGARVVVCCQNDGEASRMGELLAEHTPEARIEVERTFLHRGFVWDAGGEALVLVPYHELLHRFSARRRGAVMRSRRATEAFVEFDIGDVVVHADHGICKFVGLTMLRARETKQTKLEKAEAALRGEGEREAPLEEYMVLEFSKRTKLNVPVSHVTKIQRYIGGTQAKTRLSTLGGKAWQRQKDSVKEAVRDLAGELLRVQAAREHAPGIAYPSDTAWMVEFEQEFLYQETDDQLEALVNIKRDMQRERPMDRLVCGDVGFGKTELAIRAAFKAAEYGKQVGVLVPTTILAEQHERTFRERFADYPFKVASLSRFKSHAEQRATIKQVRQGQVDILIGTHRILSNDVRFADLGLVVIDEEQRFGVEHKNALLQLRMTADVLTLSATPIPRTLHMAMLGLRDISSLTTAPVDRRAIVTEVIPYNAVRVKRAIERELSRGGQVFFVHNRVHNIKSIADEVQKLAPDARIVIGHGQMPTSELEDVMTKFVRREADILVSTTIVESGIDIPTANTMFINDAQNFGLAELHQLRGRVGRYKHRAYCYMLLPGDRPVNDVAVKRLRAIEEFSMLGAGFKIAMRDLEIRGAGNLLGAEQSGHINAVGYDMYCRLLDDAARELKNEPRPEPADTAIDIGLSGAIPKPYIPSDKRRLEAYRRIGASASQMELDRVREDLVAAYGEPPKATVRLLELASLRVAAATLDIRSVVRRDQDIVIRGGDVRTIASLLDGAPGSVRVFDPMHGKVGNAKKLAANERAEVYYRPTAPTLEPSTLALVITKRLSQESAG